MEMSQSEPVCNTDETGSPSDFGPRESPAEERGEPDEPKVEKKKKPAEYQRYRWCATIAYTPQRNARVMFELFAEIAKQFVFQLEEADSGYMHYQACFSLHRKHRRSEVKDLLGMMDAHLEPCMQWQASKAYCSKLSSRVAGPWTESNGPVKIIEELRPWQKDLEEELLNSHDDRKIIWYADYKGGMGKTQFCKYMGVKHGKKVFVGQSARGSDVAHIIKKVGVPDIVIINITRTSEKYFNYGVVEALKDGMLFDTKYEGVGTLYFDAPAVCIFANFEPDKKAMSEDRWDIRVFGERPKECVMDVESS